MVIYNVEGVEIDYLKSEKVGVGMNESVDDEETVGLGTGSYLKIGEGVEDAEIDVKLGESFTNEEDKRDTDEKPCEGMTHKHQRDIDEKLDSNKIFESVEETLIEPKHTDASKQQTLIESSQKQHKPNQLTLTPMSLSQHIQHHISQQQNQNTKTIKWKIQNFPSLQQKYKPNQFIISKQFSAQNLDNIHFILYPNGHTKKDDSVAIFVAFPRGTVFSFLKLIVLRRHDKTVFTKLNFEMCVLKLC